MSNITDTFPDGTTVTTYVEDHDRGSTDYNRRRGEGTPPAAVAPEPEPQAEPEPEVESEPEE